MNKDEFLQRMRFNLKGMPSEKLDSIINYYNGYFKDKDINNNVDVITLLGHPDKLSRQIIEDYSKSENSENNIVQNNSTNNINNQNYEFFYNSDYNNFNKPLVKKKNNKLKTILIVLAILFSPVILGISIGIFGVLVGLFAAFISIIVSTAAVSLVGIFVSVVSFFLIPESLASFAFYLGLGLILFSIGSTLLYLEMISIKKIVGFILNKKKKGALDYE